MAKGITSSGSEGYRADAGTAEPVTAARPAPAAPVERRSPDRAINVTRPAFGKAKPTAPAVLREPAAPAPMAARTGTDDWEQF